MLGCEEGRASNVSFTQEEMKKKKKKNNVAGKANYFLINASEDV